MSCPTKKQVPSRSFERETLTLITYYFPARQETDFLVAVAMVTSGRLAIFIDFRNAETTFTPRNHFLLDRYQTHLFEGASLNFFWE